MTKTLSRPRLPKTPRQQTPPNGVTTIMPPPELTEEDRLENHPLWQNILDEIKANRQADQEQEALEIAE